MLTIDSEAGNFGLLEQIAVSSKGFSPTIDAMEGQHAVGGTKLARTKSGDKLLHEVRQQQQQQQRIEAYEEMEIDLLVRAPPH